LVNEELTTFDNTGTSNYIKIIES